MLDKIIIRSVWGPVLPHHFKRLAQVSYSRFLQAKTKQTTTYINSPLTGAQINVTYIVETIAGVDMGYVEISIPVASALIGHNYFHAGLEVLRYEIQCLELLVKVVLTSIGMKPDEIHRYMKLAKIILAEVTWHTESESVKARKACQRRTNDHMRAMRTLSPRHDVQVADANIMETKSGTSLLVTLKSDDLFRQYCKAEQIKVRRKKARAENFVSEAMRPKLTNLMPQLGQHIRNEQLIGGKTLAMVGITHPREMHPDFLEKAMMRVWGALGFGTRRQGQNPVKLKGLAQDTLRRYMAGENVTKSLPAYRVSRDRQTILDSDGPDIAVRRTGMRFNPANLGRQLQYPRRWKLPVERRDLVVSERTAPAIMVELQQGLDFITDGVLPDIADPAKKADWLQRWMTFVKTERLDNQFGSIGDSTDSWVSPEASVLHTQPEAAEHADVPQPLLQPAIGRIRSAHRFGRSISTVTVNLSDDDGFDPYVASYD